MPLAVPLAEEAAAFAFYILRRPPRRKSKILVQKLVSFYSISNSLPEKLDFRLGEFADFN
jgi:hypothetical protein